MNDFNIARHCDSRNIQSPNDSRIKLKMNSRREKLKKRISEGVVDGDADRIDWVSKFRYWKIDGVCYVVIQRLIGNKVDSG